MVRIRSYDYTSLRVLSRRQMQNVADDLRRSAERRDNAREREKQQKALKKLLVKAKTDLFVFIYCTICGKRIEDGQGLWRTANTCPKCKEKKVKVGKLPVKYCRFCGRKMHYKTFRNWPRIGYAWEDVIEREWSQWHRCRHCIIWLPEVFKNLWLKISGESQ